MYFMNFKKISILTVSFIFLMIIASSFRASNIPALYVFGFDKVIHFIEYCTLGFLLINLFFGISKYPSTLGFIVGVFFSLIDEIYQSTVSGRSSSIFDTIADIAGLIFSMIIIKLFFKSNRYDK